ncbi:MAG: FAD-dependent oxidoreductase [Oscillospiraceae bacterium]|jgi:2,4-dienoyl-CoA reductase-like NADH-dependent reductase (Old Yellow Enzyme family)/thioredoxin reductase|nr:FAD-dependent oxidoreductase [Oscillospiraceae bacterium]
MSKLAYPRLFTPVRVGGVTFKNRILASATGFVEINATSLPDSALSYYERKAQGGAAAVAVGECQVDAPGGGGRGGACIDLSNFGWMSFLKKLSERITLGGAVASAELSHAGRYSETGYGPSDGEIAQGRFCHEMSEEKILSTIAAYRNAAAFAKMCGFGMVTIHGGHGWLPQQFFSPYTTSRTDIWGGSAENRARFAVAICDAIHEACGRDFPVEIRISATELEDGYDLAEGIEYARQLDGHADIIHVSLGVHGIMTNDHWLEMSPSMFRPENRNVEYAAEIKRNVSQSLVAVVASISDPEVMEDIVASGKADFVALARQLLCDADTPNKAREGRSDEIRRCLRCMSCWSNLMNGFRCALNPETGREDEARLARIPVTTRKVLVAGGGIAGMQAAITAAERGHAVTLCEKSGALGGGIRCEESVPFKRRVAEYIALQARLLQKRGVDVRLNTEITPEFADKFGADVIIAAVGGVPLVPPIAGIENALCANDVYANPELAGRRVVIIGAGFVGAELAVYLKTLGREVTLVEQAPSIRAEGNSTHAMALTGELRRLDIAPRFNAKVVSVTAGGVALADGTAIAADTVVYATGQSPRRESALALNDSAPQFISLGDCAGVGNIMGATTAAWAAANNIGRGQ